MTELTIQRVNILGVRISAINLNQALDVITGWIKELSPHYVCVTPIHGIMECRRDPTLLKVFNSSGMTTPDGMGVVWLLRMMGYKNVGRVYGPDLMLAVCEKSSKQGWRHFFYGGNPGVLDRLEGELKKKYPGLQVSGKYSPPFRALSEEEDIEIARQIRESQPDIVWIGISTPKQERWMADHIDQLNTPVLIGVGAAFDFLSGSKPQAPRWIQRAGLEWLFRLASEPKRLWRRYAQYPLFGLLFLTQLLRIKHFPNE